MSKLTILFLSCLYLFFINGIAHSKSLEEPNKDANDDQYAFLSELYDLTSGSMWINNTNWLIRNDSISLCNWYGITCSGKWVQKISLKSNGLGGPLPDKWERIPYLESLDLSSNK